MRKSSSKTLTVRLWLGLLTLVLASCSQTDMGPEPTQLPGLEQGKAGVYGRIISERSGQPISGILVRLAKVVRQGEDAAFVLEDAFSPGDQTDEGGYFIIVDVDPIEYVLVVGDVNNQYEIIAENSGMAKIWTTAADQILEVGEIRVDLP